MRREWIEIIAVGIVSGLAATSPSMRREWIEMKITHDIENHVFVSLHAEGVD